MGKRSKEKDRKKERRRAEAAALAKSTWLAQAAGLTEAAGPLDAAGPVDAGWSLDAGKLTEAGTPPWSTDLPPGEAPGRATGAHAAEGSEAPQVPPGSSAKGRSKPASGRGVASEPGDSTQAGPRLRRADATELAARLASLSTVLQREMARADAGDGLTRARLSALSLLVLGGPHTLGELAAAEHVRPPTMTRLVHAMEAEGLVLRERHPSDGRSIVLRATAKGEALLQHGRARQIASLARTIASLGEAERHQLEGAVDLLGRIVRDPSRDPGEATG
jgi:DNA-binding MarR family transcriptional regulator